MTKEDRERAIKTFRYKIGDVLAYCGECKSMDEGAKEEIEAFNMAIQALEQQPCEDAVSREAMCKYINDRIAKLEDIASTENNEGHWREEEDSLYAIENLENILKHAKGLPSVTPIRSKDDVLDKIKAEIIEMRSKQNVGVLECLDIIDKYREPKFNVGTVGIISHGRRTFADLAAEGLRNDKTQV